MKIALATCHEFPSLVKDDQLLWQALLRCGVPAEPAIWNDPAVDWGSFSMCILRCTWDYCTQAEAYLEWARRAAAQTELWNPVEVLISNTHKSYLRQLAAQGIPIVPTRWSHPSHPCDLLKILRESWKDVIVKPLVSAGAYQTFRIQEKNLEEKKETLAQLFSSKEMMVQPYLSSIETRGELSLIFIEGQFSHAIRKIPQAGDFRSQEEFSSHIFRETPTWEELAIAEKIMDLQPFPTLYGRVDLMYDSDGAPCLGELELTEPALYFYYGEESLLKMAEGIARRFFARRKAGF